MTDGVEATVAEVGRLGPTAAAADTGFERRLRPLLEPAFRLAYTMLRDRQEAEDAVQQAALDAWRGFGRFRDTGRGMSPWFLTIVANQCRSRLRAPWWRRVGLAGDEPLALGAVAGHEDGIVLRDELSRSFARLNVEQRTVLFLYFELDLPQEEVARVMGVRIGSVKSRLHRAVRRLRGILDEENDS